MRLRFIAAMGWTIVIAVLCWTPSKVVARVGEESGFLGIPHFDKIVHAGIFAVFAFLWLAAMRRPRYAAVLWAGLALAVVTELGQMIPAVNREAGIDDAAADFLGALAGCLAYLQVARKMQAAPASVATEGGAA